MKGIYLHRNSGHWQIDIQVGNQRFRRSTKTAVETKAQKMADRFKAELQEAWAARPIVELKDFSFDEACGIYWKLHGARTKNAVNLAAQMEILLDFVGRETMCSEIDDYVENSLRESMVAGDRLPGDKTRGPQKASGGRYKPSYINDLTGLITRILEYVEIKEKTTFPDRPRSDGRSSNEPEAHRERYMKHEEEVELDKITGEDLRQMYKFAADTGIREFAICELRWKDIDWGGGYVTFLTKSRIAGDTHSIELSDDARTILVEREGWHPEFVFGLPARADRMGEGGRRILAGDIVPATTKEYYRQFKNACHKAKIVDLTVHDLRRTAGRRMWEAKDVYAAKVLLGHADYNTTLAYLNVSATKDLGKVLAKRSRQTRATQNALRGRSA